MENGLCLFFFAAVAAPILWLEFLDAARNGSEGVGRMARVFVAVRHIAAAF